VHYQLQSFFIGKATGENLFEKLKEAFDNAHLPLNKLIHLGSDGPNVNKKVYRLMNEECLAVRNQKLLNIGFCNIHLLHNVFCKDISVLGEKVTDLIILVQNFLLDGLQDGIILNKFRSIYKCQICILLNIVNLDGLLSKMLPLD
jgi:hypothetical protein